VLTFRSYASSSKGNLHTLSDGETTIMIECGIAWKKVREALDFKTSEVSGICLSHAHSDHSKSVKDAARAGLDIYLLPETQEKLGLSGHTYHPIELKKTFAIGTIKVKAFPLRHTGPDGSDVPICGFLFASGGERAAYLTDTFYSPFTLPPLSILAIEANYSIDTLSPDLDPFRKKRLYTSHFSLENVLKFLEANDLRKLREIHLIHMSRENSDPDLFRDTIQRKFGKPVYIGGSNA